MAATAVVGVASKLPWKQMLAYLPDVVRAARGIWKQWDSKKLPEPIDPAASVASQLAVVTDRIQALEANEKEQSEVVSQMSEQLEALASGLKETAARQALLLRLSIAAIVLASFALLAAGFAYGT